MTDQDLGVSVPPDKEAMVGYGSIDRVVITLEQALPTAITCWATASARPTFMSTHKWAGR